MCVLPIPSCSLDEKQLLNDSLRSGLIPLDVMLPGWLVAKDMKVSRFTANLRDNEQATEKVRGWSSSHLLPTRPVTTIPLTNYRKKTKIRREKCIQHLGKI